MMFNVGLSDERNAPLSWRMFIMRRLYIWGQRRGEGRQRMYETFVE